MTTYEVAREYDTESMMNFKVIIDTLKTARELMEKGSYEEEYEVEIVPKNTRRRRRDWWEGDFIAYIGDDDSPQFDTEFMTYDKNSWGEVCGVSSASFHQIFLYCDLYDITEERRLQRLLDRQQIQGGDMGYDENEEARRRQEALERQYETASDDDDEEIDDDISDQRACMSYCDVTSEQMDDVLEYASKLPEGLYVHYADLLKKLYKSSPKIVISKRRYLNFLAREIQLNIKIENKKSKRKRKKEQHDTKELLSTTSSV